MFYPIEQLIKENIKGKRALLPVQKKECPKEFQLWSYLIGSAGKEAQHKIGNHLVECDFCLGSLLLAQELRPGIGFGTSLEPRGELLSKAIDLAKKRKKTS